MKKYPVPETAEVTGGSNTSLGGRLFNFPAFRNRNYRLFFAGQFISVIGTWMQIVAQGWLVLQLTSSPFTLGLIAALATTPSLLFSLFGGVAVDRFNKKKVLTVTQLCNMVLALTLGTLTLLNLVSIPVIGVIAFLMGTVNAIDAPARQAFVSTVVTRDQLPSAIAMNSGIFNAARAIGPAISGVIIALLGSGAAFIINGLSYLGLLIALNSITFRESSKLVTTSPLRAIRDGLNYTFTHPLIRVLIAFTGALTVFGWSYSTLMPLIAREVFGLGAQGLGWMYTATGIGSLLATYLVGTLSKKVSPVIFIAGGNVLFSVALILFSVTSNLPLALCLLFCIGMGLLLQSATMNTLIQTVVKQEYRGRVMSLYVLMFLGMAPVGNFEVGYLTEDASLRAALIFNGVMTLAFGLAIFLNRHRIRRAYFAYAKANPATS